MKITNVKALKKIALEVRKDIIEAVYSAKSEVHYQLLIF